MVYFPPHILCVCEKVHHVLWRSPQPHHLDQKMIVSWRFNTPHNLSCFFVHVRGKTPSWSNASNDQNYFYSSCTVWLVDVSQWTLCPKKTSGRLLFNEDSPFSPLFRHFETQSCCLSIWRVGHVVHPYAGKVHHLEPVLHMINSGVTWFKSYSLNYAFCSNIYLMSSS